MPSPRQIEALRAVAAGAFIPLLRRESDGWHARWMALDPNLGANEWVDEAIRRAAGTVLSADAENQHHETLHDAWLMALKSKTGRVIWDEGECEAFARELERWAAPVLEGGVARAAICFVFSFSGGQDGSARISCAVPHTPAALRALGEAARFFGPLRALKKCGEHLEAVLSRQEAESFQRAGARALAEAGYSVEGVAARAEITASADVKLPENADRTPADGAAAEAKVELRIHVDGETVGAEEIRFLLDQGSPFVFFRNRWIEVDRDKLRLALRALEKAGKVRPLKRMEVFAIAQGIGTVRGLEIAEARAHGWLRGLVEELRRAGRLGPRSVAAPASFSGTLRDYQSRGLAWLDFLTSHGFGALLADDMGLGKTVQTIAWLCKRKESAKSSSGGTALVVAPLSLIANWRREIARFAPAAKVYVHQGDMRRLEGGFERAASAADIVLTNYYLLVKDAKFVAAFKWDAVVLDEAQAVKNPDTLASRIVCGLSARARVALTGTPVENSVADLWSIEAFLNPGFLPARKEFAERFERAIAANSEGKAAQKLRHALEPFILRRLKTEPGIAAELGPKRIIREYCELSPSARAEYETILDEWRERERSRGDVFALITRLKLACDTIESTSGGKFARLADLLESIFAAGESALIFTQYAKVGAVLKKALEKRFGREFPFLHGARSAREREEDIAAFNAPGARALILSLKAGGFGLNLVKANHVIHYDRWWNPAVEAQASDRAHRIGQTATVFVHLLITPGTIEERVDALLEKKLLAAGSVVTSGEAFLAKMTREEVYELARLES